MQVGFIRWRSVNPYFRRIKTIFFIWSSKTPTILKAVSIKLRRFELFHILRGCISSGPLWLQIELVVSECIFAFSLPTPIIPLDGGTNGQGDSGIFYPFWHTLSFLSMFDGCIWYMGLCVWNLRTCIWYLGVCILYVSAWRAWKAKSSRPEEPKAGRKVLQLEIKQGV